MKTFLFLVFVFYGLPVIKAQNPYVISEKDVSVSSNGIIYKGYYDPWDWESEWKDIIIPDSIEGKKIIGLTSLGMLPRYYLKSVALPKGLKILGPFTFRNQSLDSISLPDGLFYVGEGTFRGSSGFQSFLLPNTYKKNHRFIGWNDSIPPGTEINIRQLAEYFACFEYLCEGPYKLTAEDVLLYDEDVLAFCYYRGSKDIIIPDRIDDFFIKRIGERSFRRSGLKNVTISAGINEIMAWAFFYNQIETVSLSDCITKIGDFAFTGNKIERIEFPQKLLKINKGAFQGNILKEINIPNQVDSIMERAFNENQLTKVELSSSIVFIGKNAFANNPITNEHNLNLPVPQKADRYFLYWQGSDGSKNDPGDTILNDIEYRAIFECK